MFKKDDVLRVQEPERLGGYQWLRFTQDPVGIHGSRIKYMAEVVPACDRFAGADRGKRVTICAGCEEDCYSRKMLIKYAGPYKSDQEDGEGEDDEQSKAFDTMLQIERQGQVEVKSPFIAQTLLSGRDQDGDTEIAYVVMEKVEGEELSQMISRLKMTERTEPQQALLLRLGVIRQLLFGIRAYAVQYADSFQVHRDLKPKNIIVRTVSGADGNINIELKIIDFDLMVRHHHVQRYGLFTGGTEGYVHPQAYKKENLPDDPDRQFCHEWDLYAAGLIMYEIMEGKKHFSDDECPGYLDDPDVAYSLKPMPSCEEMPELEEIIRKLVAGEYNHIDQVIGDYQSFLDETYGMYSYPAFYMQQFLECRPGYEAGMPSACVTVKTSSEGLLDAVQNITVTYNTVTRIVYGKNLIGAEAADYEEEPETIGAFCFLNGRLRFVPMLPACSGQIGDSYGTWTDSEIVRPGYVIRYKDAEMTVLYVERGQADDR